MNSVNLFENSISFQKYGKEGYLFCVIEKILIDKEYIDIMNNINNIKFITDGKWDWEHGIGHAKRVANYTEKIVKDLGYDNITIALGIIAGLLHDVGLENGNKIDHAKESSIRVKKYLKKFKMNEAYISIISEAIADHSGGNNIKSIIGASLLLADKLDITYYRVENSSIRDEINNEVLKVRKVFININEKQLIIDYIAINNFNQNILSNWNKAISIPLKIAKYLNKDCVFKLNGEIHDLTKVLNQ